MNKQKARTQKKGEWWAAHTNQQTVTKSRKQQQKQHQQKRHPNGWNWVLFQVRRDSPSTLSRRCRRTILHRRNNIFVSLVLLSFFGGGQNGAKIKMNFKFILFHFLWVDCWWCICLPLRHSAACNSFVLAKHMATACVCIKIKYRSAERHNNAPSWLVCQAAVVVAYRCTGGTEGTMWP